MTKYNKNGENENSPRKYLASMRTDLALLAVIVEICLIVVFVMFIDRNVVFNLLCTVVTLFLMMLTYFIGLIPALAMYIAFILFIVIQSAYEFIEKGNYYSNAFFWIIMTPLVCVTLYFLTNQIKSLQKENESLKEKVNENRSFDTETNLRTVDMLRDHFDVFSTLSEDYDFSLYLFVFRIKYWNAVSGILSKKDQRKLIKIVSEILNDYKTGHEFVYDITHIPPTWGMLSTISMDGKRRIRDEVKARIKQRLQEDPQLSKVDIVVEASKVKYNPEEHTNAAMFLEDGIHELQYDVSAGSADKR
nr:hypothetical protein [uncultured Ligilactobacillus sp.]